MSEKYRRLLDGHFAIHPAGYIQEPFSLNFAAGLPQCGFEALAAVSRRFPVVAASAILHAACEQRLFNSYGRTFTVNIYRGERLDVSIRITAGGLTARKDASTLPST